MFRAIRPLRDLLTRREKVHAFLLLAGMIAGAALEMAGVGAIPAFVAAIASPDVIRGNPRAADLLRTLGVNSNEDLVRVGGLFVLGLFVIKNSFLGLLAAAMARYTYGVQAAIAERLFSSYLAAPYAFHLRRNSAELLRNTNSDAMHIVELGLIPLLRIVQASLVLLAILILLLSVEFLTSVGTFLILGGVTVAFLRAVENRAIALGEVERAHRQEMIQAVSEGLGGIKVTKVLAREESFLSRFRAAAVGFTDTGRERQLLVELQRLILEIAAVGGLLGIAAVLMLTGRPVATLIPTLTLLAVAVVRMIPGFNNVSGAIYLLRSGEAAIGALHADLLEPHEPEAARAPLLLARDIQLKAVSFSYEGSQSNALEDISIQIPRGAAVGLVGQTGSGKTTLVDIVLGLLVPTEGEVLVDGVSIAGRERAWRRSVGYIPQDVFLADCSIRKNIAFGVPESEVDERAIWRAVDAAQMREFVERLPDGLDTMTGERGVRLSGGQRQRIGIARALYPDPPVLVMDEATSALDLETERFVMEAIEHFKGSRTLILIAHRLATVEKCDRIFVLQDGRIEAEGTFEELNEENTRFRRLSGHQR